MHLSQFWRSLQHVTRLSTLPAGRPTVFTGVVLCCVAALFDRTTITRCCLVDWCDCPRWWCACVGDSSVVVHWTVVCMRHNIQQCSAVQLGWCDGSFACDSRPAVGLSHAIESGVKCTPVHCVDVIYTTTHQLTWKLRQSHTKSANWKGREKK